MAEYSLYDHNQFYKIPPKMSHLNFHPKVLGKNCQKKPFLGCFFVGREFDPLKMHFIHLLQVE